MSPPVSLTPQAWARIRYEYEHTKRPVDDICVEHGISAGTLRNRVRRWGWTPRWGAIPAQGPAALVVPQLEYRPAERWGTESQDAQPLGLRVRGDERGEDEPSPHIADGREHPFVVDDARPIGDRLDGAVARVMPALETTLETLAAGPMAPREMEQAARALGSLTRTLRELNALLAQHRAATPAQSREELEQSLARKLEAVIAEGREERPRRYLAAWEDFAAEAETTIASGEPRP